MAISLSSGRLGSLATSIKNPSTSLPILTIAPCDAAADVDRRAPSNSELSADRDRLCPRACGGLASGTPAAACRSASSSRMAITSSTSYSVSLAHDGIRRSLTLASSSCNAARLMSSALDAGEAPRTLAALRSFSKKLQETAFLSAGSKLTIFSTRSWLFLATTSKSKLPSSAVLMSVCSTARYPLLTTVGSHRRA